MKIEYRIGMHLLGVLSIVLLSVYTMDFLYFTRIPAVAPFGFGMIVFFIILDAFIVICEGKSPQLITNKGHWSINTTKDKEDIPWQVEIEETKMKDLNLLDLSIFCCGGINYWGLSIASGSEKPVVIAPAIYFHNEEKNYTCFANLEKYEIEELPLYLQFILKKNYPSRVKDNTPIYYSEVSHMDGTATPENMQTLTINRQQNKEDSVFVARIVRLYDEMERGEKHKRKIFVKKELEEVTDDNE